LKPLFVGTVVVVEAAIALGLIHFATNSTYQFMDCQQEYKSVQAGLDAYMANRNIDTITATAGTSDLSSPVVFYNRSATETNPTHVQNAQTQWSYVWDSTGRIMAIAHVPSGAIPPGCILFPAASANQR
jgi:hypothetical protein